MADAHKHKPATVHTQQQNAMVSVIDDQADFERASRGFIASHPTGHIVDELGRTVINVNNYDFLAPHSPAPATVNPSLWRHAQLNHIHGLFEVRPDVYQVRGYDISNITFIKGHAGWIVIDPLTTAQTARDSYDLVTAQLGHRPITAVIYTHSHTDHFGGVLGVISEDDVTSGRCIVVAPEHFMHETVGENVIAGPQWAAVRCSNSDHCCHLDRPGILTQDSARRFPLVLRDSLHQHTTSLAQAKKWSLMVFALSSNSLQNRKLRQR
ncbi:MAG: MBL fold metallo-hydrolase [Acidimicrobiaceae bacterium]